jgi:hypothetical protein
MVEEEKTITCNFYSKEISVKIDPALKDAIEQDVKLYGLTHEEGLCTEYQIILNRYSFEEILDMDFSESGITFPAKEYRQEMSISEFIKIKSIDSEITDKQIELITKRIKNLKLFIHITEQVSSAQKKRLKWELDNKKE